MNNQLKKSNRLKLKPRKRPYYFTNVAKGIAVGYRRNQGAGTWVLRCPHDNRRLGVADDYGEADGIHVFDFEQASARAIAMARHGDADHTNGPLTIEDALQGYAADLEVRQGDVAHATRILRRMPGWLRKREVASVTARELKQFRNGLKAPDGKPMKPATLNRILKPLKAALTYAADHDRLIAGNREAWKVGLKALPGGRGAARKGAILPIERVMALVAAAYVGKPELGLLADVAAQTGARPSQIKRIEVGGLQNDRPDPRLMIPSAFKGKDAKMEPVRYKPIPITPALAERLRQAAAGRALSDWLLMQVNYQKLWQGAIKTAGLPKTHFYSFRHSSIVRQLKAGIPASIVADQHFTSIREIEKHYAAYMSDHTDSIVRPTLAAFN
jgi:integrase